MTGLVERNPPMTDLRDLPVTALGGADTTFGALTGGRVALVVNVASRCGLTPQYSGLEALHEEFADRGFTVLGFPCNQFGGQEPGTAAEIGEFCSATYGVTFPLTGKIDVNGPGRHPVYAELTATADGEGKAGDITWNFEKFLVGADGAVLARFRPGTDPQDPSVRTAVEQALAG
jgi:glutathione peroxidase